MIREFLKPFGEIHIQNLKKVGKQYYQVPNKLLKELESIDEYPFSVGLFLGEETKTEFIPSSNILRIIKEQSSKYIVLNEKSAWLFVCGRDIFFEGIEQDCFEKGNVLVLNEHQEVLGVAVKKGKEYKNVYDIGQLLRREQKKKK